MADNTNILYLEVDEEITAAIDRMLKVPSNEVKIVVPKRSTLLQSIVNLKLLKRAADGAGKKLVLITGDQTSTHLAGRVGLAVASTLNSTANVPEVAQMEPQAAEVVEAEDEPEPEPEAVGAAAAGAIVGAAAASEAAKKSSKPAYAKPMMVHTPVGDHAADEAAAAGGTASAAAGKTPRIPNFDSLQKRLLLAGIVAGVVVGFFTLNYFIKRATVTLYAQGQQQAADFPFTADPTAKTSDPAGAIIAATNLQASHDLMQTVPATGQKDVGTKATGTVTVKNCEDTAAHPLAGGSIVTSNGKSFSTNAGVTVPAGSFSNGGKVCTTSQGVSVAVTATANGDSYNLGPANYTSPALTSNFVIAGTQMSGGTTKTVNVVTQTDLDKAKQALLDQDKDAAKKDLDNKVTGVQRAIDESFTQTAGSVTATPGVGEEGAQTTVKFTVQYNLLAVTKTDFETLLKAQEQKQVTEQSQIYDTGADSAQITATKVVPNAASTFGLKTNFSAGQRIDTVDVAKQVTGKRYGDAADIASKTPGVDKAEISTWPFWVTKLPGITSHIKVVIKVVGQ